MSISINNQKFYFTQTFITQKQQLKSLIKIFPSIIIYSIHGEYVIKTTPSNLIHIINFLKKHTLTFYQQLIDISAIDYPERKTRFEIIYFLLSLYNNQRISISISISEGFSINTITQLFSSAGWYEREMWDRFGIFFNGHTDLRRRLTDYGFKGHPLRKDFPVTGFVEVRYDDFNKRILYESVNLAQEYRIFNLENPWKL